MKYWYKLDDMIALHSEEEIDEGRYYTIEELRTIRLYTEDEINSEDYWPVHDPCGWSWEPGEYGSIDAAYDDLLCSLNLSVYEYLNDI